MVTDVIADWFLNDMCHKARVKFDCCIALWTAEITSAWVELLGRLWPGSAEVLCIVLRVNRTLLKDATKGEIGERGLACVVIEVSLKIEVLSTRVGAASPRVDTVVLVDDLFHKMS